MSIALYRKYRPKNFSEISGQNHIKVTLLNEISTGRLVHAYLFCGPRGTGKTTIARLLAKAANCLTIEPSGEPCNHCSNCEDILAGRSMDMIEIDAASHTGVDNVRENIIQNARFTPGKSKYKVFIIDEVHMLSTQAFNALLKTLEEAPKHVIFILATTEAHKVPATIISRCQRFDFKKVNFAELMSRLKWIAEQEALSVDEEVLSLVARQSGGCVRDAESLLEQILSLGDKKITLAQAELVLPSANFSRLFDFFEKLFKKQTAEALSLINRLVADGVDIMVFLDNFVEFSRRILVYKISGQLDELSREVEENIVQKIVKIIPDISEQVVVAMIKSCFNNKELFKQSHIQQLVLEMVVFDLTAQSEPAGFKKNIEHKPNAPAPSLSIVEVVRSMEPVPKNEPKPAPVEQVPIAKNENNEFNAVELSLPQINNHWDKVLSVVREKNYLLYMSLRMGKPVDFSGELLTLGFLFEIQKQRVDKPEGRGVLRECLLSLFGCKMDVATRLEPGLSLSDLVVQNGAGRPKPKIEEAVINVAAQFGGTVVESL